jgi:hypothetical protein
MRLDVTDSTGVLVATVAVDETCPFARDSGNGPGFVTGELEAGPAFPGVKPILDRFNEAYDSGDLARAAAIHETIDQLELVATDQFGRQYRVFNVYFHDRGLLFAAIPRASGSG